MPSSRQTSRSKFNKSLRNSILPADDRMGNMLGERLRALLEADAKAGAVPIGIKGKISRKPYAKRLGCAPASLTHHLGVFAEYELKLEATLRHMSMDDRLRALLKADVDAGTVPLSRANMINRSRYAVKLGCSPSTLTALNAVFTEVEAQLGVKTGLARHLPEMRAWLTASYENKELNLSRGKLSRSSFQARFGLRGGSYLGCGEIRALIDEFDARAEQENYLPALRQEELDRVCAALAAGPELKRDRKTIDKTALSVATGVSRDRFRDKLFFDAISAAQAKITEGVEASKINPHFHGRVFAFSDLTPSWGPLFSERVAIRFKQVISGSAESSSPQIYLALFNALDWIGKSENYHCIAVVAEAQDKGRVSSAGEWEDALFAYRDYLVGKIADGAAIDSGVEGVIKLLRIGLNALTSGRHVPDTAARLPGVKLARRRANSRLSLAEARPANGKGTEGWIDYVAFTRHHFDAARKAVGAEFGPNNSEPFFSSIARELGAQEALTDDPAEAVRLVLRRRLDALRSRALAIVEEAAQMYERGRELLLRATIDCSQFERDFLGDTLTDQQRRTLLRNLFPDPRESSGEEIEQGMANFLALIDQSRGGIPPRGGYEPLGGMPDAEYGRFFIRRYRDYGGLKTIAPMLNPEGDAVGAALTLYLIESGANVSVGRTLDRNCLEASDLVGYRRITGHKARANGKPIIVDLPNGSPAIRAIEWLLSAGSRLPSGTKNDGDRLFLVRFGARVQLARASWYAQWFKEFAASTPGLEDLSLAPSMIRPSVLLHAALSNDGRLMTGMALGQHGVGVSQRYQQKWPTRQLYDQNIRRFQAAFETLVMENVDEAAAKIGINAEQFEARLSELRPTGLGTFCRDQRGRLGDRSSSCSTLDCWNDCPHLLIVAEEEAIAALQLWQTSLRAVQPDWERDRPERWDEVWLPWLCLADVIEEKMVRGPMIKIWNASAKRAFEISTQPGFVPPRPW